MNIAICGRMRSGKGEISNRLCSKHGYTEFAFGDGLKAVCRSLYPDQFANGSKPRALLQGFGQDARKYDESVWTRKCFATIEEFAQQAKEDGNPFRVVISDLRQPSEYAECKRRGYVIIRVSAPDGIRINRAIESSDKFDLSDLTHETESHVDSFEVDYEIVNDGTIEELYAKVDEVLAQISGHTEVAHL